jgi:hypothetical protein
VASDIWPDTALRPDGAGQSVTEQLGRRGQGLAAKDAHGGPGRYGSVQHVIRSGFLAPRPRSSGRLIPAPTRRRRRRARLAGHRSGFSQYFNGELSAAITGLAIMERDKARKVLADYWQAVVDTGRTRWLSVRRSDAVEALNGKLPAVNHILRELVPGHPLISASNLGQHRSARAILSEAEAILSAWEMLDQARIGESPALDLTAARPAPAADGTA